MPLLTAAVVALAAVLPAAIVSAFVGGRIVRRHRAWGLFVTVSLAWAIGVALLPMAAAALGAHLQTGIVCLMGCEAHLRSDAPLSGAAAEE